MPRLTGAEALALTLQRHGVEAVFALPGVQIMEAFDAFARLGGPHLFTVRHEQATTYMALGYGRASGKVAAALVVPGPGVLNATAGLGTAFSTSTPLLLIAGGIETWGLGKGRGLLHEIRDQGEVLGPITKGFTRAMRPEEVPTLVAEALRRAMEGRPRPTAVEVPPDVLAASAEMEVPESAPLSGPEPEREAVRKAARLLREARQAAIWAGGGAVTSECAEELLTVARALQAPLLLTPEGKGAVPEDDPLCAGANYYGFGPARWLIPQCDVVLAVGTRFLLPMYRAWALTPPQRLVQIDIDPEEIGRNYPAEVGLVADAKKALRALREELGESSRGRQGEALAGECRRRALEEVKGWAPLQVKVLEALRKEVPEDGIVVAGVTNIAYWGNLAFPVYRPRTYMTSSYFATLGYAYPTSLGAQVAYPQRAVVSINGDGGFLYNAAELATAVHYHLPAVALVFVDGAYGASWTDQRDRFGGRFLGTEITNPDFARLAESFGARGVKVQPEEVGPAVREALGGRRPAVIEVPLPRLIPPFQVHRA